MSQAGNMAADNDAATVAAQDSIKPTEKEGLLFLYILGSMTNKPEVDWDLVATKAGYSTAQSARTRYAQIKKRLGFTDDSGNSGAASGSGNATIKTPASRVKKAAVDTAGSPSTDGTPTKVKKPRPSRSKKAKAEAEASKLAAAMLKNEDQFEGGIPGGFGAAAYSPLKNEFAVSESVSYGPYGVQNPLVTQPQAIMSGSRYQCGDRQQSIHQHHAVGDVAMYHRPNEQYLYDLTRANAQFNHGQIGSPDELEGDENSGFSHSA